MKRLRLAILAVMVVIATVLFIRESRDLGVVVNSRFDLMAPEGLYSSQINAVALQQGNTGPETRTSSRNDVSQPLRSVPPIAPEQGRPDPDLNILHTIGNRSNEQGGPTDFIDPLWQEDADFALLNIPGTLQNFEGVNNVNGVLPPDTNGDVGPNHYMQWVNLSFAIYSKTGTLLYGPAAGNTLWNGFGGACQTTNDGDPIVQYDHLADRWMVSQFALPFFPNGPFYQCIAVSQTGDPTGAWYRYEFQVSANKMNDYPHLGVWPDGYYMSVNQFAAGSLSWAGGGVVAFERDQMLLGQPAQMVYFDLFGIDPNLGGMLPSDLDGAAPAAGTPNTFAQIDDDAWGYPTDQIELWDFHVDWTTPAASTFTQSGVLPVAAFDANMCNGSRNCIPQQGTTVKLDSIADRVMYRLQYRDFGSYQTLVFNHTVDVNSADRAGVRWYELRNSGGNWSVFQQGSFSPDATHRWMASAAMDQDGNIALGYSASSSSMFPAIRYTGRLAGDPLGTMTQGEGTLFAGTGSQTHSASRWGDYSMLAIDPDGCTFWFTSEYLQTTSSAAWRTRIGSFQLPGCGGGPTPTPTFTPTPTNTPMPGANELHVTSITMSVVASGSRFNAEALVTVHDENNQPVSGATVSGNFTGDSSSSASGVTNASGQVTLSSTKAKNGANWTFCVTNLAKTGYTYNPAANLETCDSTGGGPTATPTPTATPGPGGTMHIGDLDGTSAPGSPGRWNATITITVHDENDNPVSGITVSGAWSSGATGTASCVTNASGQCTVTKTGTRNSVNSVTFSVTNATGGGLTYTSADNHDPDGDSNGTAITVNKP